jgi:hypothetical protein
MKACMIIAHPDDDAVFGVNFEKTFNFDWDIVTCSATPERLEELNSFQSFIQKRKVYALNLEHEDNPNDFESHISSWDSEQLIRQIKDLCMCYDVVLSHNEFGEYGHPHHKQVGSIIKTCKTLVPNLFVFGYGIKGADIIIQGDSMAEVIKSHYKSQSWVVDSFDTTVQTYSRMV